MVMATNLQPSRQYTEWYHSRGKPYLLRAQSTIIPPYVQQVGGSEAHGSMDPDPTTFYPPQQAEPGQSESTEESHGYHPDLLGGEYYPSYAEGEYVYDFELFGSPRSQYGMPGPSDTYPPHYGTHDSSSSSAANERKDIPSMFSTPPPTDDENVGRRPDRERRPPRRYTPRTTPSNHQL
ncbi:hypothetical protein GOBAR_DD03889 [Gossypium barbadense]|nr:hypothetical protein GOBAR_DD03889 [Gossypium barbadense]